jgi:hypothetical protein
MAESYGALQGKVLVETWDQLHHKFRVARYASYPESN